MQKAQEDVKQTIESVKQSGQQFVEDAKTEVQTVSKDYPLIGVAFGVALLLSLGLHLATKQKEDSAITFGVFVYAIFAAVLALILRKKQHKEQFYTMILFFSVLRLFFDVSALSVLVLSASGALVNIAGDELKKHIKTQ